MTSAVLLLGLALSQSPPQLHEPTRESPPQEEASGAVLQAFPEWLRWPPASLDEVPERGFFPTVGSVAPGGSFSLGGGYRDYGLFGTPLGFEVSALVSVRGYQRYRGSLGWLRAHRHTLDLRPAGEPVSSFLDDRRHARPGLAVYLDARYRYLPRSRFYGIGPASRRDDRTDYLLKGGALDLVVQGQATPAFGISARAGLLDSQIGEGRDNDWPAVADRFEPNEVPGLTSPPRYLVAGVAAAFDTRDDGRDRPGALFATGAVWRFDQRNGKVFDFTRILVDARTYVNPPQLPGLIALRALVSADLAAPGALVPFFLHASLGGPDLLRAYGTSRWQDRALAHATVEYRWRAHRFVEVTPFLDAGTVGPRLGRLRGGLKAGGGIGLRARWGDATLGRMD